MRRKGLDFVELSNEILACGCKLRFRAKGGSMHPFIRDGDILVIAPIDAWKISLGDVIFHRIKGGGVAAHRVIKKFFQGGKLIFITKGDSSSGYGDKVLLEEVLGRVIAIERNGRRKRFGSGLSKLQNIFYAKISSFNKWIFPLLRKIKHSMQVLGAAKTFTKIKRVGGELLSRIQSFKAYRNLARRFVKAEVFYQWEPSEDSGMHLLGKKNDIVIGRVTIRNSSGANSLYHGWLIFSIWVYWRYRRLGIGRRLTEMSCDFAAKHGASEVKLSVFKDNKRALNFYQKMGFYQVSISGINGQLREEAKKTGRQRIIMKKDF